MFTAFRKSFKRIVIHKLIDGSKFTTASLQDFLGNNTSKTGTHRAEVTTTGFRKGTNDLLIQLTQLIIIQYHH